MVKATVFLEFSEFSHPKLVWNQNFNCAEHKHNIFHMNFKKNYTWACDRLKTSNLSADNFKKILTLMGQHLSPRYGQVILVSGYPVSTAVNWSQRWCPKCVHYQFSCAPKLARKYEIEHWCPVVRTDGRCTVTWLPNFLGWIDFLSHGAPPTRALRARVELR